MKNKFKFQNFVYDINNIITPTDISLAVNRFYSEILEKEEFDRKFSILFKIKISSNEWRCVSSLQTSDKREIEELKDIFNIFWSYKSDIYKGLKVDKIVFRYRFLEFDISPEKSIFRLPTDFEKSQEILPEGFSNLPNNRLIETWGDEIVIHGDQTYTVYKENHIFFIRELDNEYYVSVKYKDKELFNFHDTYDKNEKNGNTFIRTIGSSELYYYNGICDFLKQTHVSNYIKTKTPDTSIKDNFLTMDLETRTIDNIMHVISASIYDGNETKSYYLSDFINSDELLKESIGYLFQRKYNGYRVYIHNFSKFDGTFMLRIIASMGNCEIKRILKRDSRIIDVQVSFNLLGKRKYSIYFRDSLLILPSSLKKLGESFEVEVKKSIYPYKFVNNKLISLNYIGDVPTIDMFDYLKKGVNVKLSDDDYLVYKSQFEKNKWSLRKETIKYCENDVISLYLIIKKFQIKIFRMFEADINKYPTLSSLAFSIYRIKYLKDYKIPCITGELYKNLKKSYTGGSVDVYIPVGKNINRYDVNSLYPSVMLEFPSPVGKITKFKGNILKYDSNPFGFFFVKIKTPELLHIPILQTRIKTKSGVRTISPLGEWTGWYFSEEIFNAIKNGYKIEIVWGYLFEKDYIFKEYVNELYELKKNSNKDSPDYTITKLLLNSLYGRFGMSPDKEDSKIAKGQEEISDYLKRNNEGIISIKDSIQLDKEGELELISFTKINNNEERSTLDNINVAIASSITSYARIKMSEIKSKYYNNIYYSDTDSIDLDIELPEKYISNKLGDYKFEQKFKDVIYIAPKVYAAISNKYNKDQKNYEYVIIKGYKDSNVKFDQISKLVNENAKLELNQEKWYKDLSTGKITTKEESYTLMATENKRKLIYENNKLTKTIPYKIINDEFIN